MTPPPKDVATTLPAGGAPLQWRVIVFRTARSWLGARDSDRAHASSTTTRRGPGTRLALVGPLLSDPVRAVRIEAARALSSIPAAEFEPALHIRFATVLGAGRLQDAERVVRAGLARVSDQGELHYALGLLLAEQRRLPETIAALAEAARLLPDRSRVQYDYALALQQAGRRPEAEMVLLKAQSLAPTDRSIAYALALFYSQDGRWFLAVPWAEKLVALDPTDTQAQQFLSQLRASAQRERGR
jgi:tetratricopeptide (TPR) repeat protein